MAIVSIIQITVLLIIMQQMLYAKRTRGWLTFVNMLSICVRTAIDFNAGNYVSACTGLPAMGIWAYLALAILDGTVPSKLGYKQGRSWEEA